MKTSWISPLVGLLALSTMPSAAQAQAAPVRVTVTTVSRVTLYRILPGQGAAWNQDVMDHLIPLYDEYKKAGLITDYAFFGKVTTDSPDDWNVGLTVTFANYAALDNLGPKSDPASLKHYGSAEKRTAVGSARNAIRTVVSSHLLTGLAYSR